MEHQSLCSATGIPHSTQIRTRCLGGSLRIPNSRFNNDMGPPQVVPMIVDTLDESLWFRVGAGGPGRRESVSLVRDVKTNSKRD
jgi:hypothetical protein